MSVLIGSTGFVGKALAESCNFTHQYSRRNISSITGTSTDLLICAGLPGAKWKANQDPHGDWVNMTNLSQNLAQVQADKAVLISTIDVFENPTGVDENDLPTLNGLSAYGSNRAWFELFFKDRFPGATIIRLPGLFSLTLRKNLIFDLMHGRSDQYMGVNADSEFQFFDLGKLVTFLNQAIDLNLAILNLATEPIKASEIAEIFDVKLLSINTKIEYDFRSIYSNEFGGVNGYLISKEKVIDGIRAMIQGS